MESGGGGGASPQVVSDSATNNVRYPEYMEDAHRKWLNDIGWSGNDNTNIMRTIILRNPYRERIAYNPDRELKRAYAQGSVFSDYAEEFIPEELFEKFFQIASNLVQTDRKPITDAKASFAADAANRWDAAFANYKAMMADVNAVQTSTFVIGLALLEREKQQEIARFEASAELQQMSTEEQMILNATQMMLSSEGVRAELTSRASEMMIELIRMRIVSEVDREAKQLDIDTKALTFPLSTYQHGANVLAAISGGTQTTTNREYTYGSGLTGNKGLSTMGGIAGGLALAGAGFGTAGAGLALWKSLKGVGAATSGGTE